MRPFGRRLLRVEVASVEWCSVKGAIEDTRKCRVRAIILTWFFMLHQHYSLRGTLSPQCTQEVTKGPGGPEGRGMHLPVALEQQLDVWTTCRP